MLSGPDPSVPVAQVPIDTAAAYGMAGIVRVGQSEAFENTEVRLDQVQPGGFGRRPRRIDAQLPQQSPKARVIVQLVQVIHDDEQLGAGIAATQSPEGIEQLGETFALAEEAVEAIGMHVVETEELLGALGATVGGAHASWPAARCPGDAPDRAQLERTPLVETHHRGARRSAAVQVPDQFFLRSNCGSWERFQVRMRCALKPSRRNSRRTHSSVTGGSKRLLRQYSASLGTDQLENGSPRSSGLDNATSTSSRNCSAFTIGGFGHGAALAHFLDHPVARVYPGRQRQIFQFRGQHSLLGASQGPQRQVLGHPAPPWGDGYDTRN